MHQCRLQLRQLRALLRCRRHQGFGVGQPLPQRVALLSDDFRGRLGLISRHRCAASPILLRLQQRLVHLHLRRGLHHAFFQLRIALLVVAQRRLERRDIDSQTMDLPVARIYLFYLFLLVRRNRLLEKSQFPIGHHGDLQRPVSTNKGLARHLVTRPVLGCLAVAGFFCTSKNQK